MPKKKENDTSFKDISEETKTSVTEEPPIMKYGYPRSDTLRTNGHFLLVYDRRNKVPYWVMEHLTKHNLVKRAKRKNKYLEDVSTHEYFRSTNEDYMHSGYDKGHMAPAENYRFSKKAIADTFVLSNMAPQDLSCNRGIWKRLENHVRKLAKSNENVYVCSGPLYLPRAFTANEDVFRLLPEEHDEIGKSTSNEEIVPLPKEKHMKKGKNTSNEEIVPLPKEKHKKKGKSTSNEETVPLPKEKHKKKGKSTSNEESVPLPKEEHKKKGKTREYKKGDNSTTKKFVMYEVIGEHNVAVPTHFFKIIICEGKGEVYDMEAYIVPNQQVRNKSKQPIPLENYMVSRNTIEKKAGFLIFHKLQDSDIRLINEVGVSKL